MRCAGDTRWRAYRLVGTLCLGLAVVLLPACESIGRAPVENRPAASAVRDPVLDDIPKPAGFVLVDDRSSAYYAGKVRIARCEYVGPTERTAVKRFYEEYMPSAGFELRRWSLDSGLFNLTFESNAEVCTVRIHPKDWKKRTTVLVVEIGPKAKGPTEHETKPPTRRPD